MIPERDRIRTVMTTEEIAADMERGDYSAEMLLQHLVRRYNALAWDAARVEWKYGRTDDGKPKDWVEWNNLRESLAEYVRQPQELNNLECPGPTDEERRENARAIQAMSVPERFGLMFNQQTKEQP